MKIRDGKKPTIRRVGMGVARVRSMTVTAKKPCAGSKLVSDWVSVQAIANLPVLLTAHALASGCKGIGGNAVTA